MSKVKRLLSIMVAMVMVLAMSVPAFAGTGVPAASDTAKASVTNVEEGATVTAYQIVKGSYNTSGFVDYVKADNSLAIADVVNPTSAEVTKIAADINAGSLSSLTSKNMKANTTTKTTYEADLEAGYWVVLVRGTVRVYNPMLVGVYYNAGGSDNAMTPGSVDATTNWTLVTKDAYAKSSDITITKSAKDTADLGEAVEFTVTSKVPDYSAEYTADVTYEITDTLNGLTFASDIASKVAVSATTTITANDYTITSESDTVIKVTFTSAWVKANGGATVTLVYSATMSGDAVNNNAHSNKAELTYTNNPGTTAKKDAVQKVYTFDIDGNAVTDDILKKVNDEVNTDGTSKALEGAEFTLYTDAACTTQYTNTKHVAGTATATSDTDGQLYITGLDVGTYYLKETKAPAGYTLNNTVFKIEVVATVANEELTTWTVKVTDLTATTVATNTFTVANNTVTEEKDTTNIMNTKLSALPSTGGIGTTIFTIGGCAIMIVAAGLFFATRRKTQK